MQQNIYNTQSIPIAKKDQSKVSMPEGQETLSLIIRCLTLAFSKGNFCPLFFFFRFRSSLYTITGCFKLCSLPMTACLFSNLIHYAHRFPYSTPVFGFISSALKSRVCYMHGCVAEAGSKKKKRWVKKRREMRKQCSEFLCVLFQYGQDRHKTRG